MTNKFLFPFFLFFLWVYSAAFCQTIDAELLELNFSNDGYPERFTRAENGFYFTADDSELWFTDGTLEGTQFFSRSTYSGDISLILPRGNGAFFVAEKDSRTDELWVSDGTEEGTIKLTDRNLSFGQDGSIRHAIVFDNKVLFSLFDETYGNELWISDGTIEGTFMLKDINEGENYSSPSDFLLFDERIFFKASTEEAGAELWVSDGTTDGTTIFKDMNEGDESSMASSSSYKIYNDNFYFFANNGVVGNELWKSDGTSEGTILVKDINEGSSYNSGGSFIQGGVLNGKLFFLANDGVHGTELWQTDGTAEGTTIFYDIAEGQYSSFGYSTQLIFSDSKAFFYATDNSQNNGLWVTDGTVSGTNFLKGTSMSNLTFEESGESIFFFGDNDSGYKKILWKSDGTVQGTKVVSQKATGTNISSHENNITVLNDKVFFAGETERNGIELWVSDGSDEGTSLLYDLDSSYGVIPSLLTAVGDQLFFRGNEYGYYGLCTSNGKIEGTKYLDINLNGQSIDEESEFIDFNGKLVVSANDGVHGYELWMSDGTQEGTKMIKDINTGSGSSMRNSRYLKTFSVINNRLYFVASDGVHGYELWTSDGTESGTYMVKDLFPGSFSQGGYSSDPKHWTENDGSIYFSATYSWGGGSHEEGIYKTDGTAAGTVKLFDLKRIEMIESVGDKLVVAARAFDSGINDSYYLWSIDTTEGAIENLNIVLDYNDIPNHAILNNELIFYGANSLTDEVGILKTNGTSNGTILLLDKTNHPYQNFELGKILSCGENVYFGVQQGLSSDREVWRTDGTVDGTVALYQPSEGEFTSISEMICFNDNLLYKRYDSQLDVWITNGQPDEVYGLNLEIINGPTLSGSPNYWTAVKDKLYFSGTTNESGSEIYVTTPLTIRPEGQLTDNDTDGVIDFFDKCPGTPFGESVNEEGCAESQLDDDEDGITNDVDQCPETPIGESVNAVGCSDSDLTDDDDDGVNNNLDLCPNTPTGESVDSKGCSQSQLDDDEDGIMNNLDLCPETLPIYEVDSNGCPVEFELPSNNFSIEATGATCVDKNNGQISISTVESYNYTATINGDNYTFSTDLLIQNLYPGLYNLCIRIEGEPDFERCFNLEIEGASQISGKSTTSYFEKKVTEMIEINSGTAPYSISVNDKEILTTSSSLFAVDVSYGDLVKVTSKFACEGVMEKTIVFGHELSIYPNPTSDVINIIVSETDVDEALFKLFDVQQRLLMVKKYYLSNGKIEISIGDRPSGIYYLKLELDTPKMFKIIKQ